MTILVKNILAIFKVPRTSTGVCLGGLLLFFSVLMGLTANRYDQFGSLHDGLQYFSSRPGMLLGDIFRTLPFGFAFFAGLMSAVNPCGFAMLPAYLGLYVSSADRNGIQPAPIIAQSLQIILVSLAITAGFVVIFGVTGLTIALGFRWIIKSMPWVSVLIGVGLIITGIWTFSGGKLYSNFPISLAANIKRPTSLGFGTYFLFGVAYALTSLGCTLPIFLLVVGTTLSMSNLAAALVQFLLYSVGMGVVILSITISLALFKGTIVRGIKRIRPLIDIMGSLLLMLAGAYVIMFWISFGNIS